MGEKARQVKRSNFESVYLLVFFGFYATKGTLEFHRYHSAFLSILIAQLSTSFFRLSTEALPLPLKSSVGSAA